MKKITWKEFKTMWLESFHIAMHGWKVNIVATLLGLWTVSLIVGEWVARKCVKHKFALSVIIAISLCFLCIYQYVDSKQQKNAYDQQIFYLTQTIDSLHESDRYEEGFNDGVVKGNDIAVQARGSNK